MDTHSGRTIAIIQARMGSSRLPGKVLLPLAGKEVLSHIHERLRHCAGVDQVVVATTASAADKPVVDFCAERGIEVFAFAGPQDDLLGRYIACAESYGADIVVMVCGDCPLLHPATVDRMVQALRRDSAADYARLDARSIEGGVAVLRLAAYRKMAELASEPAHREHATLYLMENPEQFRIVDVSCEAEFLDKKHRLWLDTPADLEFLQTIYARLYRPGKIVDLSDVVRQLEVDAELRAFNAHVTQKDVREAGICLFVDAQQPGTDGGLLLGLIRNLIELYHVPVRIFSPELPEVQRRAYEKAGMTFVERSRQTDEGLVRICPAGRNWMALEPSADGAPGLELSFQDQDDPRALADLLAGFFGYRAGTSGYYQPAMTQGAPLDEVSCPLCANSCAEPVHVFPSAVTHGLCPRCGHTYLQRRLDPRAIEAIYRDFGQNYPEEALLDPQGQMFALAHERLAMINGHMEETPRSVLEIGCGYGHLLSLFGSQVFRVGVEPSACEASFARKHFGLAEVWNATCEQFKEPSPSWPRGGFDLICSFHALEHMAEPAAFLEFVRKILHPQGRLVLSVPDLFSLSPDFIEHFYLSHSLHLHTFSPGSMSNWLKNNGFVPQAVIAEEPRAMLRSSFTIVARRAGSGQEAEPDRIDPALVREALSAFYQALGQRISGLQAAMKDWLRAGKQVALYGGGLHTLSLLEATGWNCDQVAVLIDDDASKQGTTLRGIQIGGLTDALRAGCEVVLVSSLAAEDKILQKLHRADLSGVEIRGVYGDF